MVEKFEYRESPIHKIFATRLKSTLIKGSKSSVSFQPYLCLSLDISVGFDLFLSFFHSHGKTVAHSRKLTRLQDALNQITRRCPQAQLFFGIHRRIQKRESSSSLLINRQSSIINHQPSTINQHKETEREGEKDESIKATKRSKIDALPEVLVFHLQRFCVDEEGAYKITRRIQFPQTLTIDPSWYHNPRAAPSESDRQFRLFSVVTHHGESLSRGHYTCDVFCDHNGKWIKFDDDDQNEAPLSAVLSREAYLLFYRRG